MCSEHNLFKLKFENCCRFRLYSKEDMTSEQLFEYQELCREKELICKIYHFKKIKIKNKNMKKIIFLLLIIFIGCQSNGSRKHVYFEYTFEIKNERDSIYIINPIAEGLTGIENEPIIKLQNDMLYLYRLINNQDQLIANNVVEYKLINRKIIYQISKY